MSGAAEKWGARKKPRCLACDCAFFVRERIGRARLRRTVLSRVQRDQGLLTFYKSMRSHTSKGK
jgi:hypothetical protein